MRAILKIKESLVRSMENSMNRFVPRCICERKSEPNDAGQGRSRVAEELFLRLGLFGGLWLILVV